MSRQLSPRRLFGLVAVAIALVLTACGGAADEQADSAEPALAGYSLEPVTNVDQVVLPAANRADEPFSIIAEPDRLLLTTFGFTNCPDICPTTLSDIRIAFNQLGARADDVDLAWISIDPERDTAQGVTTYVEAFIDKGIALRTDDGPELDFAKDMFAVDVFFEENADGDVEVAHTANIYIVDDEGSIILTWPFGISSADMVSDLNILFDRAEQA